MTIQPQNQVHFISAPMRLDGNFAIDLGLLDYGQVWKWQHVLHEKRARDEISDCVILCEHPPVITVGRRKSALDNILTHALPVYEVERGGDATYHGPGQLVCYPILKLAPNESDPHQYLRTLEDVVIEICKLCHVNAARKPGYTGVWTQDLQRKICSLGVALRGGVTFHGFALNVTIDVKEFQVIHPCGLDAQVMTSLQLENGNFLDHPLQGESLVPLVVDVLGRHFKRKFQLLLPTTFEGQSFMTAIAPAFDERAPLPIIPTTAIKLV